MTLSGDIFRTTFHGVLAVAALPATSPKISSLLPASDSLPFLVRGKDTY